MSAVIIDCGSGYTKMGFAGAEVPAHVIPTVMNHQSSLCEGFFPLLTSNQKSANVLIGNDALKVLSNTSPIEQGRISDWTNYELFLRNCYSQFLKIDPSDRPCILTEPPLNASKSHAKLREVMFETFGVPSLYIGVQAVLALYTYWDGRGAVTGTVVDAGDGVTHVIPVTDGYVTGTYEMPVGGQDVTNYIAATFVARTKISPSDSLTRLAKQVKEKLAYVSLDLAAEHALYEKDPLMFQRIQWTDPSMGETSTLEIGRERFLASEVFFSANTNSLPCLLYNAVQAAPIDCRKGLLSNIVLSGGSTLLPNFAQRLENEVTSLANGRVVKVLQNMDKQRYAVWHGASVLAQTAGFDQALCTRSEYFEGG